MESCVIAAVYLNYEDVSKRQIIDSMLLLREIKILLLSPNKIRPYFQLPMIRMLTKANKVESIKEGIRTTFGIKSKAVLKMTEIYVHIDKTKHKTKSLLMIVFFNSTSYKDHIDKSEFISISDLGTTAMGEQSMDYIAAVKKWIKAESIDPLSLLDWFKSYKRGDVHPFKSKRTTPDMSLDRTDHKTNTDIFYKSTSLETIARPDSASNVSHSRHHADSLDRISEKDKEKEKARTPTEIKNAIKSKITKPKVLSNSGPISAVPMQETAKNIDQVITNPLLNCHFDYTWHSDVVVNNPFWNQRPQPDLSQIGIQSKSLFVKNDNVSRSRCWSVEYPLHFAAYKGDMALVTSLVDKGCNCMERDHAGWTPLHYAVWYGHIAMVSLFLNLQLVSVNCCTADSLTPLHLALVNQQSAITELLLKQPDVDTTLKNNLGEGARVLAEKYDKQFMIPLIKLVSPKLSRIQVALMDNNTKSLILSHGPDTTFQQLRLQMLDMMDIPTSCFDVFNFWVGYRVPKFTGKNSIIPCECFGPMSMPLKDLESIDFKLYWKRNVFLGVDKERKVKHAVVLSLLFSEAVQNFTKKSHYPCDTKDVSLLSSVLLYRHLPSTDDDTNSTHNLRVLSLNRVNRPLSFVLGSKLNGQSRQMSASVQTLKDRPKFRYKTSSFNDLTERAPIIDQRSRQAKAFLSSYKNLALILPKKKLKTSKINWSEEIIKKFLQSPFSYKNYSFQEREYRFLSLCWNLTLYGCAYFHVEIKVTISIPFTDCILAVNDMGVYFLHSRTKNLVQNYKYSTITWHPSATDKCLLLFTKRNNIYIKTKHSLMISDLMLKLHSMNP